MAIILATPPPPPGHPELAKSTTGCEVAGAGGGIVDQCATVPLELLPFVCLALGISALRDLWHSASAATGPALGGELEHTETHSSW